MLVCCEKEPGLFAYCFVLLTVDAKEAFCWVPEEQTEDLFRKFNRAIFFLFQGSYILDDLKMF